MSEIVFYSRFTVHECFEQLKRARREDTLKAKVECTLVAHGFQLSVIRGYNNPYAPIFRGKFEELNNGTKIQGSFGFRKTPLIMMVVGILGIGAISGLTIMACLVICLGQIVTGGSIIPSLFRIMECLGILIFMLSRAFSN